jgi:hypothetical protein
MKDQHNKIFYADTSLMDLNLVVCINNRSLYHIDKNETMKLIQNDISRPLIREYISGIRADGANWHGLAWIINNKWEY